MDHHEPSAHHTDSPGDGVTGLGKGAPNRACVFQQPMAGGIGVALLIAIEMRLTLLQKLLSQGVLSLVPVTKILVPTDDLIVA